STRSSSRRRSSTASCAAPSSTSLSCRSRRRRIASSASSRSAPARPRRRPPGDREAAHPPLALGALGGRPSDRGLPLLRPAHAGLDRAAQPRLGGGVPRQARLTGKLPAYENICAPMTRYVYDFDEPSEGGRNLLGGKGVGLAEMTQLGVPVPAGFTITTDACRAFMASGGEVEGLDEEVAQHIARIEEQTGKRFRDPDDPLLVSVRSGAAISMPGMMATILNVGLNDESVEG